MNKEAFNKGLETRRAVLGADYVDNSLKNADEFNIDRKSTRLNSSHSQQSRMPSSA